MPNNTAPLVTIDKFDPNSTLVNINKLKPYRFVEDQTFQTLLTKSNDLLLENLTKTNNYDNLFIKKLVILDIPSNLVTKKLVKTHSRGLPVDNQVRKGINYDLSNQKLIQGGFTNLLEQYLIVEIHVKIIFAQINEISVNLIVSVNF